MPKNKFIPKQISTYTGKPRILYQKEFEEFESRERVEMYRDIMEPFLKAMQSDNPALPYVKLVIEKQ